MPPPDSESTRIKKSRRRVWFWKAPGCGSLLILVAWWLPFADGCSKQPIYPQQMIFLPFDNNNAWLRILSGGSFVTLLLSIFLLALVVFAQSIIAFIRGNDSAIRWGRNSHFALLSLQSLNLCMIAVVGTMVEEPGDALRIFLFTIPIIFTLTWIAGQSIKICKNSLVDQCLWLQGCQAILSAGGWLILPAFVFASRLRIGWFWGLTGLALLLSLSVWQWRWAGILSNERYTEAIQPRPIQFGVRQIMLATATVAIAIAYPAIVNAIVWTFFPTE